MNVADVLCHDPLNHHAAGRVYGVVIAIVTSVNDEEELGRVKLSYPWLGEETESPWVRVVTPMAGPNRGIVFRPEPEDEVLVAFEHGDMRRPFVLGALWNGEDALPEERGADGDNSIRLIRTRSGHLLLFDDTEGEEKITITDKSGNIIELHSEGITITSEAIKIGSDESSEGLVLGDAMMELFNQHTHPTGVGPSGVPTELMEAGTHVSEKHKTE